MEDMVDEVEYWKNVVALVTKEYWSVSDQIKASKDADVIAANKAIMELISPLRKKFQDRFKAESAVLEGIKAARKKQVEQEQFDKQM